MRATPLCLFSVSFGLTLACSDQSLPIATDNATPQGTWVSDQASLTITDRGTTVQVLASGGCVAERVGQEVPQDSREALSIGVQSERLDADRKVDLAVFGLRA